MVVRNKDNIKNKHRKNDLSRPRVYPTPAPRKTKGNGDTHPKTGKFPIMKLATQLSTPLALSLENKSLSNKQLKTNNLDRSLVLFSANSYWTLVMSDKIRNSISLRKKLK